MERNKVRTFPHTSYKINSKWIKDLSIRPETITFLKENIGRTVFDINHSNNFWDLSLKVKKQEHK